jgi:hypothetical protein
VKVYLRTDRDARAFVAKDGTVYMLTGPLRAQLRAHHHGLLQHLTPDTAMYEGTEPGLRFTAEVHEVRSIRFHTNTVVVETSDRRRHELTYDQFAALVK